MNTYYAPIFSGTYLYVRDTPVSSLPQTHINTDLFFHSYYMSLEINNKVNK